MNHDNQEQSKQSAGETINVQKEGAVVIKGTNIDIREGGAELAAKAMVTLMAVHRDKLVLNPDCAVDSVARRRKP